jgi:hypothetical protein
MHHIAQRARYLAVVALGVALLGGCSNPRYVSGPGMESANVNVAMARCRLFAESGGTAVSASGAPAFVAGAVVGAAIGNAVRQNRLYNDCMQASGFVAAGEQAVASAPVVAPPPPTTLQAAPPPVAIGPAQQTALAEPQLQQNGSPEGSSGPIEFRCPVSGTVVEYNTGGVLTFSSGSGFACSYADTTGDKVKYAGFGDDPALLKAGLDRFWPLVIGAQQEMTVAGGSVSSVSYGGTNDRFIVLRREVIAVPAGVFYAVLVEQTEATNGGNNAQEAKRIYWWAPELGLVVKSTYTSVREPRYAQSVPTTIVPGDYVAVRINVPGKTPAVAAPSPAVAPVPAPPRAPMPTPVAAPASPSGASPADRLQALKDLLDRKLITPQEYETRRKALLDSLQPVP